MLAAALLLLSDKLLHTRFRFPARLLLLALALPYAQVVAVLIRTRATLAWWLRLPYLFLLFPLDVATAVRSTLDTLLARPRTWAVTPKSPTKNA